MDDVHTYIAFTPSVKAKQTDGGSRHGYAKMEVSHGWETRITPDLAHFIEAQTSGWQPPVYHPWQSRR